MSEKPNTDLHEEFDPLAEARRRANVGRQIYEKFMDDDVEELTIHDRAKGHADMADYLEGRPDSESDTSTEVESNPEVDEYKNMQVSDLAKLSAEAQFNNDRTTQESVDEEIMNRVIGMNLSEEKTNSDGTSREKSEKDNFLDLVLKLREVELERLKDAGDKSVPESEPEEPDNKTESSQEQKEDSEEEGKEQSEENKVEEQEESKEDLDQDIKDATARILGVSEEPQAETTPEAEEAKEFNPWVQLGEVMQEVQEDLANKEANKMIAALMNGDAAPLIAAGIPPEFIEGTLRKKLLPDIENQMRLKRQGKLGHEGYIPSTALNKEIMDLLIEISREKIRDKMPDDEDEYYSTMGKEEKNPDDKEPNLEISDVTLEALDISRDEYARLSAKRRGEILGRSKEKLAEAKENYEAALLQANQELMQNLMETEGMTPDQAKMIVLESSLAENRVLMQSIADERIAISSGKRFAKFYDWFGKQRGFKGFVKKVAATAAVTVPIGIAAGVAGVALLGPVGGGLAGAAMARGITRGLAVGKINKEAGAKTLAEKESLEDIADASNAINDWMMSHPGETPPPELITSISEQTTRERLKENRKRTGKLVAIGALLGAISYGVNDWLHHSNGPSVPKNPTNTGPQGPTGPNLSYDPAPPTGPTAGPPYNGPGIPPIDVAPKVPGSFQGIPVLDGKGFITDVRSAGLVPRGMEQDLVTFLHNRGLDGGADITGFKNLRMFHTTDGYSHFSDATKDAVKEFYTSRGLAFPANFWDRFTINPADIAGTNLPSTL